MKRGMIDHLPVGGGTVPDIELGVNGDPRVEGLLEGVVEEGADVGACYLLLSPAAEWTAWIRGARWWIWMVR